MAAMKFVAALGFSVSTPVVTIQTQRSGMHAEQQLHRCSLKETSQDELSALVGHRDSKHAPCGSFLETSARRTHAKHSFSAGVDYLSFIWHKASNDAEGATDQDIDVNSRKAVWVNGYPRSGSSTILSMVAAAGEDRDDSRALGNTFSLFEPCHDGDAYSPWLEAQGCSRLLAGLTKCDFDGIQQLWGWPDSHTTSNHSKFSPDSARDLCMKSKITAFKTVDYGHNISDWRWFLEEQPQLRIIDIVRDPRGIFASWKTTKPFDQLISTGNFYTLSDVCNTFAANLDLSENIVYHVVFEELTKDPMSTMKKVYDWLEIPFEGPQEKWIQKTFNAAKCPEPKPWEVGFTDCHEDSAKVGEKWRTVLSDEEKDMFANSAECQRVVEHYGFPKE